MRNCLPTLKGSAYTRLKGSAYNWLKASARTILLVASTLAVGCAGGPPPLEPGSYESPLVRLQQLVGENNHLHTDEVRYRASVTGSCFTAATTSASSTRATPGEWFTSPRSCATRFPAIAASPAAFTSPGTATSFTPSTAATSTTRRFSPVGASSVTRRSGEADRGAAAGAAGTGCQLRGHRHRERPDLRGAAPPWPRHLPPDAERVRFVSERSPVSTTHGACACAATPPSSPMDWRGLAIVDVTDPKTPALVGRAAIDGQARGLAIDGDHAFVAAGSAGLVVVDVSDLRAPKVKGARECPAARSASITPTAWRLSPPGTTRACTTCRIRRRRASSALRA